LKEKPISSTNAIKDTDEKRGKNKIFSFSQMFINSQNLRIYTAKNDTFPSSGPSRKLTT